MLSTTTELATILGGILIAAVIPGPSFLMVSQIAVARSRREALAAAIGIGLCGTVFASLALAGIIELMTLMLWPFVALKVFGGVYLVFIAMQLWHIESAPIPWPGAHGYPRSIPRSFRLGFITHLINPKAILAYVGVFAAILPPDQQGDISPSLLMGIFVIEAGWYTCVALIFSYSRLRHLYQMGKKWLVRGAAGLLAWVGLTLLMDSAGVADAKI